MEGKKFLRKNRKRKRGKKIDVNGALENVDDVNIRRMEILDQVDNENRNPVMIMRDDSDEEVEEKPHRPKVPRFGMNVFGGGIDFGEVQRVRERIIGGKKKDVDPVVPRDKPMDNIQPNYDNFELPQNFVEDDLNKEEEVHDFQHMKDNPLLHNVFHKPKKDGDDPKKASILLFDDPVDEIIIPKKPQKMMMINNEEFEEEPRIVTPILAKQKIVTNSVHPHDEDDEISKLINNEEEVRRQRKMMEEYERIQEHKKRLLERKEKADRILKLQQQQQEEEEERRRKKMEEEDELFLKKLKLQQQQKQQKRKRNENQRPKQHSNVVIDNFDNPDPEMIKRQQRILENIRRQNRTKESVNPPPVNNNKEKYQKKKKEKILPPRHNQESTTKIPSNNVRSTSLSKEEQKFVSTNLKNTSGQLRILQKEIKRRERQSIRAFQKKHMYNSDDPEEGLPSIRLSLMKPSPGFKNFFKTEVRKCCDVKMKRLIHLQKERRRIEEQEELLNLRMKRKKMELSILKAKMMIEQIKFQRDNPPEQPRTPPPTETPPPKTRRTNLQRSRHIEYYDHENRPQMTRGAEFDQFYPRKTVYGYPQHDYDNNNNNVKKKEKKKPKKYDYVRFEYNDDDDDDENDVVPFESFLRE